MSHIKDLPISLHDQRLLACAALVRNGTGDFDMQKWKCGTACCAVGWYTEAKIGALVFETTVYDNQPSFCPINREASFKASGWLAVEIEFKINHRQALWMFSPDCYEVWPLTREIVATRIEKFVADRTREYAVQPIGIEHV